MSDDSFFMVDGKIDDKHLSPYGRKLLSQLNGEVLHFTDGNLTIRDDKLVDAHGHVVETIDNDRMVNKIMFKIL